MRVSDEYEGVRVLDCADGRNTTLVQITHTLRPLGVAMAGRDVYDPYKD